jgi:hypothetical protein
MTRNAFWVFRSRPALWFIRTSLLILVVTLCSYEGYLLGECEDGFKNPARCKLISDAIGGWFFAFSFLGFYFLYYISPIIVVVSLFMEFWARRKAKGIS